MFSDRRVGELMDQIMELVSSTFFDAGGSFKCIASWPEGSDRTWFEIRIFPAVVELVGGKNDGETVYQGFRVDLKALQEALFPLFDQIEEWEFDNVIGQADDLPRPAITISGTLKGDGGNALTIHICPYPPEDAEVAEKYRC